MRFHSIDRAGAVLPLVAVSTAVLLPRLATAADLGWTSPAARQLRNAAATVDDRVAGFRIRAEESVGVLDTYPETAGPGNFGIIDIGLSGNAAVDLKRRTVGIRLTGGNKTLKVEPWQVGTSQAVPEASTAGSRLVFGLALTCLGS